MVEAFSHDQKGRGIPYIHGSFNLPLNALLLVVTPAICRTPTFKKFPMHFDQIEPDD